jgi:hypothetical protein
MFVRIEDRQPHGHVPVRGERPELRILMPGDFHSGAGVLAEEGGGHQEEIGADQAFYLVENRRYVLRDVDTRRRRNLPGGTAIRIRIADVDGVKWHQYHPA